MGRLIVLTLALISCSTAEVVTTGQCTAPGAASDPSCRALRDASDEASSVLQVRGRGARPDASRSPHAADEDEAPAPVPKNVSSSSGSRLVIKNACGTEAMWIASMFREVDREQYPNNVKLEPGESMTYAFPAEQTVVATRFWPKMGCDEEGENCRMGSSGGPGQGGCPPTGCAPPVDTKFEATWWDKNTAEPVDWWDTSGVDGYTVPYTLSLDATCPQGKSLDCSTLTLNDCPTEEDIYGTKIDLTLRYQGNSSLERVGCYSPCGKLTFSNWDNYPAYAPADLEAREFCCPTPPESVEACRAGPVVNTSFVHLFREKCRDVYSYAYDDAMGLQTCPVGTTYTWTLLCP